jgi:hypothetical protein
LNVASKRLWANLRRDYVLGDAAAPVLLPALCEARDRAEAAREVIKSEGAIASRSVCTAAALI